MTPEQFKTELLKEISKILLFKIPREAFYGSKKEDQEGADYILNLIISYNEIQREDALVRIKEMLNEYD